MWWEEDTLSRHHALLPLRLEIDTLERTRQYQLRMWKSKEMLSLAKRGLRAARYHLTKWRREAVSACEKLVREMFEGGRGIVDVGLALVAHMDGERTDAIRIR